MASKHTDIWVFLRGVMHMLHVLLVASGCVLVAQGAKWHVGRLTIQEQSAVYLR